jgi:hypothetical protein
MSVTIYDHVKSSSKTETLGVGEVNVKFPADARCFHSPVHYVEFGTISNYSPLSCQCAGEQFSNHKRFVWDIEGAADAAHKP